MANYPHRIKEWLLDLFFPIWCVRCNEIDSRYLCQSCLSKIPYQTRFTCIGCNKQVFQGETCWICRDTWQIDHLFITADYKNPAVAKLVKLLKYSFIPECAISLSLVAERYISYLAKQKNLSIFELSPAIIPVPLSPTRYNWRGFNQADLIAHHIGHKFLIPVELGIIKRTKEKTPQANIKKKEERIDNTKGVFEIVTGAKIPQSVLLIDDVCTTGATLSECARILKQAGAKQVDALVIARG